MGKLERVVSGDVRTVQQRLEWQLAYEEWQQGPLWREKRRLVFERCRGICEGCGVRRAVEVHHVRYPRGELPGSEGWKRLEKLWDMVGICERCHREIHEGKGAL